jgi:hypothetical protein
MELVTDPVIVGAIVAINADLSAEVAVAIQRARRRLRHLGLDPQALVRLPGPPQARRSRE